MFRKIPKNICRICEKSDVELINITLTESKWIVDRFLNLAANVSYDIYDDLPKFLCKKCTKNLIKSYEFKQQCETTHQKFLSILVQPNRTISSSSSSSVFINEYKSPKLKKIKIEIIDNDLNDSQHEKITSVNKTEILQIKSESEEYPVDFLLDHPEPTVEVDNSTENTTIPIPRQYSKKVKVYAGITSYECYMCSTEFATQKRLEQHMKKIHLFFGTTLKNIFECNECNNVRFLCATSLCRHKRIIHRGIIKPNNRPKVPCEHCQKLFSSFHIKERHIKNVHHGEKPFVCRLCYKSFAQKSTLKKHISRVHNKERDYKCETCGKDYPSKKELLYHQVKHMSEEEKAKLPPKKKRPYYYTKKQQENNKRRIVCEICGRDFNFNYLEAHKRTHNGLKPYKCDLCYKFFGTKRQLVMHAVMHKDARPYNCDLCDKTFRRYANLYQHKKRHSTEKPYKCLECNKAFQFTINLRLHQRTHTGAKPFVCMFCNESFASRRLLKIHNCQQQHV